MSRLHSLVYLLPELLRTLCTPQITVRYPFGPLSLPSYYRGRVVVDEDLCRGCGQCVRDCPALALELERESRDSFKMTYYLDRCIYCGQCEYACRFDAIKLVNEFEGAAAERSKLEQVVVDRRGDA